MEYNGKRHCSLKYPTHDPAIVFHTKPLAIPTFQYVIASISDPTVIHLTNLSYISKMSVPYNPTV